MSERKATVPHQGRRNPRLVTLRRGGLLDEQTHRMLSLWAADCAYHVLDHFTTARPVDDRPWRAIELARQWARREVTMTVVGPAAVAAHAAARDTSGAAKDAARAAGHAAATGHMADHELGPAFYALQAVTKTHPGDTAAVEQELRWQVQQLPSGIADLVLDDMRLRSAKFRGVFDSVTAFNHPSSP